MKVIPLSEGAFTIDGTKEFVPFNLDDDNLQERPRGSLLVEIQPFLILDGNEVILLDTGLGFKLDSGDLQIYKNLEQHNLKPEQVTVVILSHLHKDHAGGMGFKSPDNSEKQLSFPNAKYYIHKQEFDFASAQGLPSYDPDDFEFIKHSPQVVFLEGDSGSIPVNGIDISFKIVGGHCPYHLALWLMQGEQTVFFGGDNAPQLQQMKSKFIAKYDKDGRRAMELREEWWKSGHDKHWTYLFYHDIKTPEYTG